MLDTENDDLDMESFMANLAEDAANFPPRKREHFMRVMHALMDCYKSDDKHGIVLLKNAASEAETMMLMAINADPSQVDDMIDTLCNFRGMNTADSAGTAVN